MKKRKTVYILLLIIFLCTGAFSAYKLIDYYSRSAKSAKEFESLRPDPGHEEKEYTPDEVYGYLKDLNPDFVGWVTIEGTELDYPVMQKRDYVDYYLRRNFEGEYSYSGTPYIDEKYDFAKSENCIIYSHNMKDGTMFSAVENYSDYDFYSRHPIIHFDTTRRFGDYRVVYAMRIDVNNTDFVYSGVCDFTTRRDFDAFIKKARSISLYDTGIEVKYGDSLLTLSTCEYTHEEGRFVVIAKRINEYYKRSYDKGGNPIYE